MTEKTTKQQITDAALAEVAAQVLTAEFPARMFSVPVLIGRGTVSTVYRADSDGEAFAVKLHPAEVDVISEYEREEYERERRWTERAAAISIPCPRIFAVGWLEGTAYSIQSFIAGVNGLESSVDPLGIWKELGQFAWLINTISVDGADDKWQAYLGSVLAGLTGDDAGTTHELYAAHQRDDLRHVFEKLSSLPLRYGLSHCDLHPRNTVVTPEGRVVLLDWGAISRDINLVPHVNLGLLLWDLEPDDAPFRVFLAGYGLSKTEFDTLLPEVLAVDLVGCFWFSGPPHTEFEHELVARVRRLIAAYLPMLAAWASRP